jgi:hypothetical protein
MLVEHNRNDNASSYQYSKRKKGAKTHIKVLNDSLSLFGLLQKQYVLPIQSKGIGFINLGENTYLKKSNI